MQKVDLDFLVEIAKEVEAEDPILWGKLNVGKNEAYKMIGTSILETFDKFEYTYEDKVILLSTITKLTVENMILNLKVLTLEQKDS